MTFLKQLLIDAEKEAQIWRIRYKMHPKNGIEMTTAKKMIEACEEMNLSVSKEDIEKIYGTTEEARPKGKQVNELTYVILSSDLKESSKNILEKIKTLLGITFSKNKDKYTFNNFTFEIQEYKMRKGKGIGTRILFSNKKIINKESKMNINLLLTHLKREIKRSERKKK